MHTYRAKIIDSYIDVLGHVNHATYLKLMEEARWDLYDSFGISKQKFVDDGIGPIVTEINIKYRKEILLNETISIETECLEYRGPLIKVRQVIYNENKKRSSQAEITLALLSLESRTLLPLEGSWKDVHDRMISSH